MLRILLYHNRKIMLILISLGWWQFGWSDSETSNLIISDLVGFSVWFQYAIIQFSLTWVTSFPNSTPRRLPCHLLFTLLLYFLFFFYISRFSLLDFPSISYQASLPFVSCCHQTTTSPNRLSSWCFNVIGCIYR